MVIQQSMQGLLPCNTLLPPLRVLITGDFFNTHRRLHSEPQVFTLRLDEERSPKSTYGPFQISG
jgi:hypothetical protein